jgi:hypothetical protein
MPISLQEVEATRISRYSVHECGKVVSRMHRPTLPPRDILGTSVILWEARRAIVRPEGFSQ